MLDPSEQYSCAFFSLSERNDLPSAQQTKLDVTIGRLRLDQPRLRVLDIGCGWGTLAAQIAQLCDDHKVFGITLAQNQLAGALNRHARLPRDVGARLTYMLADYRDFLVDRPGAFDRIVSVGMFEHVGLGNHAEFLEFVDSALSTNGRALVHSIVRPTPGAYNEWIRRYIFPGSFLPTVGEMVSAAEKANLIVDAVHIHPPSDYRKTIQAWRQRFESAWLDISNSSPEKYDEAFRRMWTFYLAAMETIFTEDLMNFRIVQIELRKAPMSDQGSAHGINKYLC